MGATGGSNYSAPAPAVERASPIVRTFHVQPPISNRRVATDLRSVKIIRCRMDLNGATSRVITGPLSRVTFARHALLHDPGQLGKPEPGGDPDVSRRRAPDQVRDQALSTRPRIERARAPEDLVAVRDPSSGRPVDAGNEDRFSPSGQVLQVRDVRTASHHRGPLNRRGPLDRRAARLPVDQVEQIPAQVGDRETRSPGGRGRLPQPPLHGRPRTGCVASRTPHVRRLTRRLCPDPIRVSGDDGGEQLVGLSHDT